MEFGKSLITGIGLGVGFAIGGWLMNALSVLGKIQTVLGGG